MADWAIADLDTDQESDELASESDQDAYEKWILKLKMQAKKMINTTKGTKSEVSDVKSQNTETRIEKVKKKYQHLIKE